MKLTVFFLLSYVVDDGSLSILDFAHITNVKKRCRAEIDQMLKVKILLSFLAQISQLNNEICLQPKIRFFLGN